jgi:hypothetical protein
MGQVPFVSIGHVRSLKYLDLSNNRIAKIEDPYFQVRGCLHGTFLVRIGVQIRVRFAAHTIYHTIQILAILN